MRATTPTVYLAATLAGAEANFTVRSDPAEEPEDMVVTWTKPGRLFRAGEITVARQVLTVTEVKTIVPIATFALRSVEPTNRNTKRAFLNKWSSQGCADDDNNIPRMVSPFPYQLATWGTSDASCMRLCDQRDNSLAVTQNGSECWCGEREESLTYVDRGACDVRCAGEPGKMCDGKDKLGV